MDAPAEPRSTSNLTRTDKAKERQKNRLSNTGLTIDQLIELYRQMLLIRRFEEKSAEVYVAGKIGGFCHLYIGQEAVGVGAISAIRKEDYVLASYREHGLALAKGMSARSIMAELFGKATGCSKGKGGSMHMFDKNLGFLGGHAIVGGQIPLATGTAFATKYQGTDQVTLCFFGEAAVNQGAFHESLNMAQLWKLPCHLHLRKQPVRNGHFPRARHVSARHRAKGVRLRDGFRVCRRHGRARMFAKQRCAPSNELAKNTCRRCSKFALTVSWAIRCRIPETIARAPKSRSTRNAIPSNSSPPACWRKRSSTKKRLEEIDRKVREEVEDALRFADESPLPDPEELYTDVYANPIEPGRK